MECNVYIQDAAECITSVDFLKYYSDWGKSENDCQDLSGRATIEAIPEFNYYALILENGNTLDVFDSEASARLHAAVLGIECEQHINIIKKPKAPDDFQDTLFWF